MQALRDSTRANPGYNDRVVTCKATLAKWLGRARVTKPIALETWMVMIAQGGAKMNSQDEAGVVMTVNLPLGNDL